MVRQPFGQRMREQQVALGHGDEAVAQSVVPEPCAARLADPAIEMAQARDVAQCAGQDGWNPISANLCVMSAIRIVGLLAMRGGLADGRGLGCGVVVSARGLAGAGTGDRCLEGSAQGQVGRRPAAHAVAASGLRTLAARDRGPGQEGEPGRSVRRGLVEAAEEVGGLAARVVRRAVSRTGDRDVGRWRVPGQGVRRDDGEGAGQDRSAVAPALQRAPSVAGVRLLQAHGDRRTGYGRSVRAVSGRRGRLCARRPGLLDRCGPAPCGVRGRLCHRAREHRVAVASPATGRCSTVSAAGSAICAPTCMFGRRRGGGARERADRDRDRADRDRHGDGRGLVRHRVHGVARNPHLRPRRLAHGEAGDGLARARRRRDRRDGADADPRRGGRRLRGAPSAARR